MSAAAMIPCLIPLAVVIAMRRAEARIHGQLDDARALTPESAIQLSLRRSMDGRRLEGLVHGGAVRVTADGRHYLDLDGWSNYQQRRRARVLLAISILIALIGIGIGVAVLRAAR